MEEEAKLTPPAVAVAANSAMRAMPELPPAATWHFLRRVTDFCTWTTCFDCHHRARVTNAPIDLIVRFFDPKHEM